MVNIKRCKHAVSFVVIDTFVDGVVLANTRSSFAGDHAFPVLRAGVPFVASSRFDQFDEGNRKDYNGDIPVLCMCTE